MRTAAHVLELLVVVAADASALAQETWRHPAYWAAWVLWGLPE